MENLDTTANNFFEVASNYTWIVVIAALIVVGFLFIIGGQQGKERARSWIPLFLPVLLPPHSPEAMQTSLLGNTGKDAFLSSDG